jgi:uncharacterized protein with GYD domain
MTTYIALFNLTGAGIKAAKDSAHRLDAAKKLLADMGGEMKQFYMVMGEFDFVGICEAPDDAVLARYVLQLGRLGFVRTQTLRRSRRPPTAKSSARSFERVGVLTAPARLRRGLERRDPVADPRASQKRDHNAPDPHTAAAMWLSCILSAALRTSREICRARRSELRRA